MSLRGTRKGAVVSFALFDVSQKPTTKRRPTEEDIQDAKLLYHFPSEWDVRQKRNTASLIEGLISLTGSFTKHYQSLDKLTGQRGCNTEAANAAYPNSDEATQGPLAVESSEDAANHPSSTSASSLLPLRSIHTRKHTILVEEVEPHIWMALTVLRRSHPVPPPQSASVPTLSRTSSVSSSYHAHPSPSPYTIRHHHTPLKPPATGPVSASATPRDKHSSESTSSAARANAAYSREEYEEAANDSFGSPAAWSAVLLNCYEVFRLLHGRIRSLLPSKHKDSTPAGGASSSELLLLHDLLEDYVPAYLDTVDGTFFPKLSFLCELEGFHFAPVQRNIFLQIQSLISILHRTFPGVLRYTAILYKGYMLYYSLTREDMVILYSYLVRWNGSISPRKLNELPFGRIPTAASQPGGGSSSFGRSNFVFGRAQGGASSPGWSSNDSDPMSFDSDSVGGDSDGRTLGRSEDYFERFLFGPSEEKRLSQSEEEGNESSKRASSSLFVPTIHLLDGTNGKLAVLLYFGLWVIFVLDSNDTRSTSSVEFYYALKHAVVGRTGEGRLRDMLRPIASLFDGVANAEDLRRFVYFNAANRAIRISNREHPRGSPAALPSTGPAGREGEPSWLRSRRGSGQWSADPTRKLLSAREMEFADRMFSMGHGIFGTWRISTLNNALRWRRLREHNRTQKDEGEGDDEAQAILAACGHPGVKRVFVKSADTGWISAAKSMERGFMLFLDDTRMTFGEAKGTEEEFRSSHFSHILM